MAKREKSCHIIDQKPVVDPKCSSDFRTLKRHATYNRSEEGETHREKLVKAKRKTIDQKSVSIQKCVTEAHHTSKTHKVLSESVIEPHRKEFQMSVVDNEKIPVLHTLAASLPLPEIGSRLSKSEREYIERQAIDRKMPRGCIPFIKIHAEKDSLDTNTIRTFDNIHKDWIIVTHARIKQDVNIAKICSELNADFQRIQKIMAMNMSIEDSFGLYPRTYLFLKREFESRGSNTTVSFFHYFICFKEVFQNIFNLFHSYKKKSQVLPIQMMNSNMRWKYGN